jgi:uncharacterized phage protein (TIGR01671 family)
MNREIKFRAWDNQEKEMIINGCIGSGSSSQLIIIEWNGGISLCNAFGLPDGSNPTFDNPVTKRFELMQFTGLKDKNGKEIYEGDILKVELFSKMFFISFGKSEKWGACFCVQSFNSITFLTKNWSDTSAVIGNIYENPDLLIE